MSYRLFSNYFRVNLCMLPLFVVELCIYQPLVYSTSKRISSTSKILCYDVVKDYGL